MPISLAPLNRRSFLRRSLSAATGLYFGNAAHAAEIESRAFALLSDPHLAANRDLVSRGVNMAAHFKRVSEDVVAWQASPAAVLITGDCAYNSGEPGDYALLNQLLRPIRRAGLPVHLTVGNHDHRERFWQAFADERKEARLPDRQVALLKMGGVNWFILDSLEATLSSPGLLGAEQLHWLADTLDLNPLVPAIVVIHHNPGLNGGNLGLKDTLLLFEVIRPRTQVKAYFYGHTHAWGVETDPSGIHLINLPPVSYVFRQGLPSGWVRVLLQDSGMQLELRSVDPAHEQHGQKVNLSWRV